MTTEYTVQGTVRNASGQPIPSATVVVLQHKLRAQVPKGDPGTTDDAGHYSISFTGEDDLDLVVRASSDGSVLATSAPVVGAAPELVVDLMVGGTTYRGVSEYESLDASLQVLLTQQEISALDIAAEDEALLADQAGVRTEVVHAYAVAARLSEETGAALPASVFYAFVREGLPEEKGPLFQLRVPELEDVLRAAIDKNLVSPVLAQDWETKVQLLKDLADEQRTATGAPLKALMDTLPSPLGAELGTLAATERDAVGDSDEIWAELEDQSLDRLNEIKVTAELGNLTFGNTDLVDELQDEVRQGQEPDDPDPRKVADLSDTWWDNNVTTVPDGIPGATTQDKKDNYISHIKRVVERTYPTRVIERKLNGTGDVAGYLHDHSDFTFEQSEVDDQDARAEVVRQWQRTFRIAPAEGRKEAIEDLITADMDSAASILRAGFGGLKSQLESSSLDDAAIETVWQKAWRRGTAANLWTLKSVETLFGIPVEAAFKPNVDDRVSWQNMFGSVDYCECDHFASVYSPAAYLADLLHWIGNEARNVLFARRPDLPELQLSCKNTETLVPYIDLAIEVLEHYVDDADPDARQSTKSAEELAAVPEYRHDDAYNKLKASTAKHPWNLPFDLDWAEAWALFDHAGFDRPKWRNYLDASATYEPALERLRIGAGKKDNLTVTGTANEYDYWGMESSGWPGSLCALDTLLDQASFGPQAPRLSLDVLQEVLGAWFVEPNVDPDPVLWVDFGDNTCSLTTAQLKRGSGAPDADDFKRLRLFLQLKEILGWDTLDVDRALAAFGTTITTGVLEKLADIVDLTARFRLPVAEVLTWCSKIDTAYDRTVTDAAKRSPSLFEQIFHDPTTDDYFALVADVEQERSLSTLSPADDRHFWDTDPVKKARARRKTAAALQITEADLAMLLDYLSPSEDGSATVAYLGVLYRMVSLSKALKITIWEILAAFRILSVDIRSETQLTTTIVDLVDNITTMQESDFSIVEIDYLLTHTSRALDGVAPTDSEVIAGVGKIRDALRKQSNSGADALPRSERNGEKAVVQELASQFEISTDVARLLATSLMDRRLRQINLAPSPVEIDNDGAWPRTSVTATGGHGDVEGGSTAALLNEGSGASGERYVSATPSQSFVENDTCVYSVWLKKNERTWARLAVADATPKAAWFDLDTGAVGTDSGGLTAKGIEDWGGGWYRCWMAWAHSRNAADACRVQIAASNGGTAFAGESKDAFYAWGAQVEAGKYPTQLAAGKAAEDFLLLSPGGLTAKYYEDAAHTEPPKLERVDQAVDLQWTTADGDPGIDDGTFSICWEGQIAATSTGAHSFTVVPGDGVSASLQVDGVDLLVDETSRKQSPEVRLESGSYYDIQLKVSRPGPAWAATGMKLLWTQPDATGSSVIPTENLIPVDMDTVCETYRAFDKIALLSKRLDIGTRELKHISDHGADFENFDVNAYPAAVGETAVAAAQWGRLNEMFTFAARFPKDTSSLVDVLESASEADARTALASLTGWDQVIVDDLCGAGGLNLSLTNYHQADSFGKLYQSYTEMQRHGLNAKQFWSWATEATVTSEYVSKIRDAVSAGYKRSKWLPVAASIRDKLRPKQRDALAAYVIADASVSGVDDVNDLYGKLLVDCAMEPCMKISRVKLALNSVQLFVQRCLLNLEPTVSLSTEQAREWKWRKNYRVWEANQKVFLYPENWIEPELRDDKTPFFKELESELLESDVTKDTAENAYRSYLDKLADVARLEVVGMCEDFSKERATRTIHVIGRTAGNPHTYYYRNAELDPWREKVPRWSPWERVDLDIDAEYHVMPVVWNGRLVLLWPLIEEEPNHHQDTGYLKTKKLTIQLAWSIYRNGAWTPKRATERKLTADSVPDVLVGPELRGGAQVVYFQTYVADNGVLTVYVLSQNTKYEFRRLGRFIFPACVGAEPVRVVATGTIETNAKLPKGFNLRGQQLTSDPTEAAVWPSHPRAIERTRPGYFDVVVQDAFSRSCPLRSFFYQDGAHTFFVTQRYSPAKGDELNTNPWEAKAFGSRYYVQDFYHPWLVSIVTDFERFGVDGLLDPHPKMSSFPQRRQRALMPDIKWFDKHFGAGLKKPLAAKPSRDIEFGSEGACSIYNWELYFHIPMLVAERLSQNQQFEEAMRWYHYIFDPTSVPGTHALEEKPYHFWKVRPLFEERPLTLTQMLDQLENGDPEFERAVKEWEKYPFRPHLVARHRPVAYMKSVVMKYLDNLLAWADQLFRRDSIESITEATQLYILAAEILGRRPEILPAQDLPTSSYNALSTTPGPWDGVLLQVENKLLPELAATPAALSGKSISDPPTVNPLDVTSWALDKSTAASVGGTPQDAASFSRDNSGFTINATEGPDTELVSYAANVHRPARKKDKNGNVIEGVLLEPEAENLLTHSNAFSNAAWGTGGYSGISTVSSPTGEDNASKITNLNNTGLSQAVACGADQPIGLGFWLRRDTNGKSGTLEIISPHGTAYGHWKVKLEDEPTGPWGSGDERWVRITASSPYVDVTNDWQSTSGGQAGVTLRAETGEITVHLFNAQQEEGRTEPTSDIVSGTSTATRNTDSAMSWGKAIGFGGEADDKATFDFDILMPDQLPSADLDIVKLSRGGADTDRLRVYIDTSGYLKVESTSSEGDPGSVTVETNCCDGAKKRVGVRIKEGQLEACVYDIKDKTLVEATPSTAFGLPVQLDQLDLEPTGGIVALNKFVNAFEDSAEKIVGAVSDIPALVNPGGEATIPYAELVKPSPTADLSDVEIYTADGPKLSHFCVPHNKQLLQYWDTVADRLFKIRHCMNIKGVVRTLPQFQPPIDPALLVRAAAAGVDISSVLDSLYAALPHYRFRVMAQKSLEFANEVRSFGSVLLSALEKRDAESLARLRSTHEVKLATALKDVRKKQVEEAKHALDAVKARKKTLEGRRKYYQKLLDDGLSPGEEKQLEGLRKAKELRSTGNLLGIYGSVLHLLPDVEYPGLVPKFRFGGSFFGRAADAISKAFMAMGEAESSGANTAAIRANHQRRQQEWTHHIAQADKELAEIDKQLAAAKVRKAVADAEQSNQALQLRQAKEAQQAMKTKFTNRELYSWMVTQISGLYFQSYKLAHDLAKQAERCYQHELATTSTSFIQFGYWDSLKKGLMAGEKLAFDIRRMEAGYLEANEREYELTKSISLAELNPLALLKLRSERECYVSFPEEVFDLDYPTHYMRRLKTVSLSIPCVAGPHTTVSCSVQITGSKIRRKASRDASALQSESCWANSTIATSHGQNDSGLFELNLGDERYLPFEGMGAVSEWKLTLPDLQQFDYDTISDVVFTLRYTAREGGDSFKRTGLEDALEDMYVQKLGSGEQGLMYIISARRDLPDLWDDFVNGTGDPREIQVAFGDEQLPHELRDRTSEQLAIDLFLDPGDNSLSSPSVTVDSTSVTVSQSGDYWTNAARYSTTSSPWTIEVDETNAEKLRDLIVVVHYETT